jgi:nucleotide-binding universal stress UspA family protein
MGPQEVSMFEKILVPLDGSELAEQALLPAIRLAEKFDGEVLLLRVAVPEEILVSLPTLAPRYHELHSAELRRDEDEAEAYLYGIKMQYAREGVPLRTQVIAGTPPEMIVAVASAESVDLIVMSTHGRTGFNRLIYGSVAEAVLRGAHVPLLLVPIRGKFSLD